MVAQWRHLQSGGNSGIYIWATPESIKTLSEGKGGPFPSGIEVQVLDHGYKEQYEKRSKKKADWFTTNGDVFPVGSSTMTPFAPTSPDGRRSFPSKNLSKGFGEWNHYYVRCINGEIRLWVNGEEVSGGNNIEPASGYLCYLTAKLIGARQIFELGSGYGYSTAWFARASRLARTAALGFCASCGYDLTGNVSGICPECGSPATSMTFTTR